MDWLVLIMTLFIVKIFFFFFSFFFLYKSDIYIILQVT